MRVALAILACLLPLSAQATKYTFADSNGVPSCDDIDLAIKQQLIYGDIYHERCDPPSPTFAGSGVSTKIRGSSHTVWSFSITDGKNAQLYLLDLAALTWVEYNEGDDNQLQRVASGLLLKGYHKPPASAPAR